MSESDGLGDRLERIEHGLKELRRRVMELEERADARDRPVGLARGVTPITAAPVEIPVAQFVPPFSSAPVPPPLSQSPAWEAVMAMKPLPPPVAARLEPAVPSIGLEERIGKNLVAWVGAIVLVLGMSFFLKYAWDQGWIRPTPTMRLIAAMVVGVGIAVAGEWVWRKKMAVLGAACYGAGVAIVMGSFMGAYLIFSADERPLDSLASFVGVALGAAAGIALALRANMATPGAIALIGAYLAPFALSTGQDKSLEMLVYLTVVSAVGWVLNLIRPTWYAVRVVAFGGTWICYAIWWNAVGESHRDLALTFAGIFFAGFFCEMIGSTQRLARTHADTTQASRILFELERGLAVLSLLNTAVAVWASYQALSDRPSTVVGSVAVGLAMVHAVAVWFCNSRPFKLSSILQSAALLTLAVPWIFDQHAITLAWAAMALLVCVLGSVLEIRRIYGWAVVLWVLAVWRLVFWDTGVPSLRTTVFSFSNFHVSLWLLSAWGLAMLAHLIANLRPGGPREWGAISQWVGMYDEVLDESEADDPTNTPPLAPVDSRSVLYYLRPWIPSAWSNRKRGAVENGASMAMPLLGTMLFLFANLAGGLRAEWSLLALAWGLGMIGWLPMLRARGYWLHAEGLLGVISAKWFFADSAGPMVNYWDGGGAWMDSIPFLNLTALAGVVLVVGVVLYSRRQRDVESEGAAANRVSPLTMGIWIAAIAFVLINVEACRMADYLAGEPRPLIKQVVLSVLWGVIGFAGVWVGFARRVAALRYGALVLLGVTLAKILLVDMAEVKAILRILSFVAVGLLLLGVSYVYHKKMGKEPREMMNDEL